MNVVFLGPPGAGKGTQAKEIAKERGLAHISTGDILRENVARGTKLGVEAKKFMDSGALVPDEVVVAMVGERLKAVDCVKGFILDGFPRTMAQAKELEKALRGEGKRLDGVVYFRVDDAGVVERLSGRRMCRKCGANFHVQFMPSAKGEACDRCGGELYQRDDDRAETIRERLQVYYRQTADLVRHYREGGVLKEIDGSGSPAEVREAVRLALAAME